MEIAMARYVDPQTRYTAVNANRMESTDVRWDMAFGIQDPPNVDAPAYRNTGILFLVSTHAEPLSGGGGLQAALPLWSQLPI